MSSQKGRSRKDLELDLIDRKILSALRSNARLTNAELAEKVGLSASPCWTRVKRLEETGVIEGYTARINQAALGLSDIAFVEVTLNKHEEQVLERFGRELLKMSEVLEAHLVTGDYDYLLKVAVSGTEDYERFLREKLYRIEGVQHSKTALSLRALKYSTSPDPLMLSGRRTAT